MSRTDLVLRSDVIEIRDGTHVLGRLEGGATAILPTAARPLHSIDIESAIERAEDWLMPFSKSLRGAVLHVQDTQGQLRQFLAAPVTLEPADVEQVFTRAADDIAFGRPMDRVLLAGLVLLRELVHHGALSRVEIE
ncbi:hypothetical protein JNX00_12140 [Hydrogenophaga sp. YM1]|uniref:hypothetical protein n=1 Tax=Hydrogenophaga sp. YM1 TaxID=2806262 RepID=UPI00195697B5|nr:hypothetical protein [Hydrogenophaga sp. YM1]QRR32440.1 hypothetical protein JNX00_12140 [Hydrogenophaga sp. YM1]